LLSLTSQLAARLIGLSGVRWSIAGFADENLTKFRADELEARWNRFHAKIKGSFFTARKMGWT
jgi:hypothetical protein